MNILTERPTIARWLRTDHHGWLLAIMLAAAALRLYKYTGFSLSNDELSALNRLHFSTFGELVSKGFYVDGHPGGIQVFLWYWVRVFGESEASLRLPFVLMGTAAVWMIYKVGRQMFGAASGLFGAAAVAFLQFPLLYSQVARPYVSGMLFCLMLVYFWFRIFFDANRTLKVTKPSLADLTRFAISATLCMYNHYFSFLFALTAGITGFAFARKHNLVRYLLSALATALLFAPHIPITINHLSYKGVGLWLAVPGKYWLLEHIYYIFDQSLLILAMVAAVTTVLIFRYQPQKTDTRLRLILLSWFLVPVAVGYLYSVKVNPVLQHPMLIFSFPCLILLIFSYAGSQLTRMKQLLLAILLVTGIINTVVISLYYKKQHFGEFRDTARLAALYDNQLGSGQITTTAVVNSSFYLDYYLHQYGSSIKFDLYATNSDSLINALSGLVRTSSKPYFMLVVTKPAPPEADDIIRSVFPGYRLYRDYSGFSSFALYSRTGGMPYAKAHRCESIWHAMDTVSADAGKAIMDSTTEYSRGIETSLNDISGRQAVTIQAQAQLSDENDACSALLVISVESNEGKSIYWKGADAKYVAVAGKWFTLINTLHIDSAVPPGAKLKVYLWNRNRQQFAYRQLECNIYTPQEQQ